jgi:2-polyprenyl-3-methyl-5-hydroxy-6-metoxy-1,4-benzoquinol methylase
MRPLFNRVAENFTRETDRAIEENAYLRGRIALELVRASTRPGDEVLDYGCGPGRLSLLLARAGFRVRGVDISDAMIAQTCTLDRRGLDLEFQLIEEFGEKLPPSSFDAIVCSSVIEYVVDPDELLRQFRTALRRSGVLVISYANESSLWRRYHSSSNNPMYVAHHHVWNWRRFRALLARNGFRPLTRPMFFESPVDRQPFARLFRRVPFVGSLGMVAARVEAVTSSLFGLAICF